MAEEPDAGLAQRVKERMEQLRLNPHSTDVKAGLKTGYTRDILRGKVAHPSATKLRQLAIALETSIQHLLRGEDETPEIFFAHPRDPFYEPPQTVKQEESYVGDVAILPVRFELLAEVYRKASSVSDKPLGYVAASVPPALRGMEQWYELIKDDSMAEIAPTGSLVHVVPFDNQDRRALVHGDIVIVAKRLVDDTGQVHLVERSMRRVVHRFPDLGLWFLEYATGDAEADLTDDVLKSEDVRGDRRDRFASQADLPLPPSAKAAEFIKIMNARTPEEVRAILAKAEEQSAKIVGKVVRITLVTDWRAGFGFGKFDPVGRAPT